MGYGLKGDTKIILYINDKQMHLRYPFNTSKEEVI